MPNTPRSDFVAVNGTSIGVVTHRTWAPLQNRLPDWQGILRDNPALSVFSTPEWLSSWWTAFGSNRQMLSVELKALDGELLALVPMYLEQVPSPWGGRLKRLRFVGDGSGDSDNLDLIVKPNHEDTCAAALLQWLTQQSGWHLCEFNTLPWDSGLAHRLVRALTTSNWTFTVTERPRLTIDLPETWDDYQASLSSKERTKIRYYTRRLERRYDVRYIKCTSEADLEPSLTSLFTLHQKRWQRRTQPGTFASTERRRFYWQMSQAFLERNWLELWLLTLNDKPVAAQFGFRYKNTVYSLQEGFDPDYSSDRVGFVLRAHVLKQLIGQGVRRYDFLAGQVPSKQRWGTRVEAYVDLHFAKPRTIGAAYLAALRRGATAKEYLRHRLPAWAWNTLRALRQANVGRALILGLVTQ